MAILYRSYNVAVAAAGTVVTHSLSAAVADQQVLVTPKNNSTSFGVTVLTSDANTVTLAAPAGGATADVSVLVWHSIQGGPTGG